MFGVHAKEERRESKRVRKRGASVEHAAGEQTGWGRWGRGAGCWSLCRKDKGGPEQQSVLKSKMKCGSQCRSVRKKMTWRVAVNSSFRTLPQAASGWASIMGTD